MLGMLLIGALVVSAISAFVYSRGMKLIDFMMHYGHFFGHIRHRIIKDSIKDKGMLMFFDLETERADQNPLDAISIMQTAYIMFGSKESKRWLCVICMGIYLSLIPMSITLALSSIYFIYLHGIQGIFVPLCYVISFYPFYYEFANR